MHANNIAFGIEIETHMPGTDTTPIGGYHNGLPVAWLPAGWKAERDGSIRTPAGRKPCEFVSPVLRGYEGLANVETAVDAIKERGARVNESCGLHVTVSWNGDAAALARLISLIANHEGAIYASTGTKRRERTHWAKQIKTYGKGRRRPCFRWQHAAVLGHAGNVPKTLQKTANCRRNQLAVKQNAWLMCGHTKRFFTHPIRDTNMTISQLIELLEDYREQHVDDTEVRLMTQQNWPFENRIAGVTSGAEMNEASEEDPSEYFDDQDVAEDAMVYIVEGGQICYGSKRAWETCRDC